MFGCWGAGWGGNVLKRCGPRQDPEYVAYEGRRIRLTDERLAHILGHPKMRGMERAIPNRGFIIASMWAPASGASIYVPWSKCRRRMLSSSPPT